MHHLSTFALRVVATAVRRTALRSIRRRRPRLKTDELHHFRARRTHLHLHIRLMRSTYGTESTVDFDPSNLHHQARRAPKLHRPSGRVVLPESFSTILSKTDPPDPTAPSLDRASPRHLAEVRALEPGGAFGGDNDV
ncbi:hypothetical protein C8Q76DRAFT_792548 [Earliella scabrosa]|nr:hypothetical protein C8Q76DRAFT_792548 [Earliella scabrosa]